MGDIADILGLQNSVKDTGLSAEASRILGINASLKSSLKSVVKKPKGKLYPLRYFYTSDVFLKRYES
jgi:hypothetical protein